MALTEEQTRELARLETLAVWLDSRYETPFGVRVGWDGIIGLVPLVGEFITTLISAYLIARAALLGASTAVLLRMGLNVAIDDAISLVPFLGWIGDFLWKSNLMNTRLLREHLADPRRAHRRSIAVLASVVAVIIFGAMTFALLIAALTWVIGAAIYTSFN
jgi:hypothetical protein